MLITKILISAYFHSSENTSKNENLNDDDKSTAEAGKSSSEGHRSIIIGQNTHPTKPDP